MRSTIAAIASLIVFTSLAAACSGESRMTISEYASWCGDTDESVGDGALVGITWGEFEDLYQPVIDEYRRIENQIPDEASLLIYHRAKRGAAEALRDFARQQDEDEIFNGFALLSVGLAVAASIETAEASLSPRTRTALISTGCIEEDDDSAETE